MRKRKHTRTVYTRLDDGTWGARGPVAKLIPGKVVGIARRDGSTCHRIVSRVLEVRGETAVATLEK